MISLKEYAHSKSISYEAVRKQIKRYSEELEGHISVVSRIHYLDDYAVDFLDGKRLVKPIVVVDDENVQEMRNLQQENKDLAAANRDLMEKLLKAQNMIIALKDESNDLKLAVKELETKLLLEETTAKELQEVKEELQQEKSKGIFARIFGR